MAAPLIREWAGIQQFPNATQAKLVELLGKLKQENVNTLTILVMGKGGLGKSSTVNSLIGERVVAVSAFQSEGPRPVMVSRSRAGFTLNVIDTPGLIEGGYVNDQALEIVKRRKSMLRSKKAYCPPKVVIGNPCLEYVKYIVFPWFGKFELERRQENGGNKVLMDQELRR